MEQQHKAKHGIDDLTSPGAPGDAHVATPASGPADIFGGLSQKGEVPGPAGQHFGSDEHQTYGNEGAKAAGYTGTYAPGSGKYPFELTQGDISLLCGDEFDAREQADIKVATNQKKLQKAGVFDSFWRLAQTPSKNPGREVGTQDEIVYALYRDVGGDARFQAGGVWAHLVPIFNQKGNAVKVAVENRYLWSASVNFEHFSHPGGKTGPKDSEDRGSAGGSYHALHESALKRAYMAKQGGQAINDAMAHDAAAQHFLQDGFSSGHVRTPRREMNEYWNGKYPLLNEQFKKSVAQAMAVYINANETNVATVIGNVRDIYAKIIPKVDEKAGALPPLTMDPLVGLVAHDVDNHEGVWVKNDWAAWQSFGDGKGGVRTPKGATAPPADQADTRHHAEEAVTLSVHDVQNAFDAPAGLNDAALFAHVRSKTGAPAQAKDTYGAEQAMPKVDTSKETSKQTWQVGSLRDLWKTQVRTDGKGGTYGSIIENSFQDVKGDFHKALEDFHNQIEPTMPAPGGSVVHPQIAFDKGFRDPLTKNPLDRLEGIINFNPAGGQNYVRDDGATMADLKRLDKVGADRANEESGRNDKQNLGNSGMRWLTIEQRAQYVKNLVGGFQGDDEIERIYELFISTSSGADRRAVFKLVEGHNWSGDVTRKDSMLWNVFLDDKRRMPFVKIMNMP